MLRDNLAGLIELMLGSAGAYPLALCTARKKPSDDRPPCLENPRPEGAESTLTENAPSPFHADTRHKLQTGRGSGVTTCVTARYKQSSICTRRKTVRNAGGAGRNFSPP